MNTKHLLTFLLVIEENSFAGAARKLHLTNAAVSKQINTLEESLGVILIKRTTRKVTLTEAGHLFYDHAKNLANEINEIQSLFSTYKKEPSGHLKIGSSWHFAEHILIPNLEEFSKLYPKITIELLIIEKIPDLSKEGIDINMGHTFVGGPDDIIKKVGETRYVLCASPAYLDTYGIPKKPQDLVKHRYITHRMRQPDNVLTFKKGVEIVLDPFLRLNDSRTMIQCALNHLGIIKLHRYAVTNEMKQGRLIEILKGWDDSKQPINICYQPQRYVQPKIRTFLDFIYSKISKDLF